MAETTTGGAYLLADKKTWVDANGQPIKAPPRADRREHDDAQAEAERLTQQAARVPAGDAQQPLGAPSLPRRAKNGGEG